MLFQCFESQIPGEPAIDTLRNKLAIFFTYDVTNSAIIFALSVLYIILCEKKEWISRFTIFYLFWEVVVVKNFRSSSNILDVNNTVYLITDEHNHQEIAETFSSIRENSFRFQKYEASIGLHFYTTSAIFELQQFLANYEEAQSEISLGLFYFRFDDEEQLLLNEEPLLLTNGISNSQVEPNPPSHLLNGFYYLVLVFYAGVIAFAEFASFLKKAFPLIIKITKKLTGLLKIAFPLVLLFFVRVIRIAFPFVLLFFVGVIKISKKLAGLLKKTIENKQIANEDTIEEKEDTNKDLIEDEEIANEDTIEEKEDTSKSEIEDEESSNEDLIEECEDTSKSEIEDEEISNEDLIEDKDVPNKSAIEDDEVANKDLIEDEDEDEDEAISNENAIEENEDTNKSVIEDDEVATKKEVPRRRTRRGRTKRRGRKILEEKVSSDDTKKEDEVAKNDEKGSLDVKVEKKPEIQLSDPPKRKRRRRRTRRQASQI